MGKKRELIPFHTFCKLFKQTFNLKFGCHHLSYFCFAGFRQFKYHLKAPSQKSQCGAHRGALPGPAEIRGKIVVISVPALR